jgi:hypothetical protein
MLVRKPRLGVCFLRGPKAQGGRFARRRGDFSNISFKYYLVLSHLSASVRILARTKDRGSSN